MCGKCMEFRQPNLISLMKGGLLCVGTVRDYSKVQTEIAFFVPLMIVYQLITNCLHAWFSAFAGKVAIHRATQHLPVRRCLRFSVA